MNFCCLGDEETVRGFRLAGIRGEVVTTPAEAAAALQRAVERPDCGIVIITDRTAAGIRSAVDAVRFERDRPVILEIPGPGGPLPGRKSLRQLVQEAVGISLGQEDSG